jgi:TRAP-type mannitol/chloroaromatic compound transport system substrate-binding protein
MENTQLKALKEKCQLFNQFMIEKAGMPAQLFEETNRLLEKAYDEKNIKILKAADADNNEQVKHMPLPLALELKSFLKQKLNIDFDVIDNLRIEAIEKVLQRGKIVNSQEYELLLNRVDEIYTDNSKKEDVKKINELLATYHKQ